MKYFFFMQSIYSVLFFTATGQTEQWDTYMAKFDGKPGSVLVDMGYKDAAPDSKYPFLVVTGPQAMDCDKKGIPANEEIDKLEEILGATGSFMNGVTAKVLVGTLTYNCERVNYYYVKDTFGVRTAIARMYTKMYPNYTYAVNLKADKLWTTYRTFLYPDRETLNWMENNKIVTEMLRGGDSLTKPRDVVFELYFKTDTGRSSFVAYAQRKGYKTDTTQASKSPNMPYQLIIKKYGPVKMDLVNEWTTDLKNELKKYSSIYAGWSAPLLQDIKR